MNPKSVEQRASGQPWVGLSVLNEINQSRIEMRSAAFGFALFRKQLHNGVETGLSSADTPVHLTVDPE